MAPSRFDVSNRLYFKRIGEARDDLAAVAIGGLAWHENAPAFESIAIDERGGPLRMIATDPRVFAAHELWLSKQDDRQPIKRRRDSAQAEAVARIVARYLTNLPYDAGAMRMLPRSVFDDARPLFRSDAPDDAFSL